MTDLQAAISRLREMEKKAKAEVESRSPSRVQWLEWITAARESYAAALELIEAQASALAAAQYYLSRYDTVDNGHCSVCLGHRLYTNGKPGKCESAPCPSHAVAKARARLAEAQSKFVEVVNGK